MRIGRGGAAAVAASLAVCLWIAAARSGAEPAPAADTAFFRGKTIAYIVSTEPGGGYDTYARLIGRHLGAKLGAQVVVRNVPGAGHLIGLDQLNRAAPDGLTIGTFNTGLIYAQLLEQEGMTVDLMTLSWVGKAASDARVFVVGKDTPFRSVADLRESPDPVRLATSGVGSASHNEMGLLSQVLGFEVKRVVGYGGKEGEMGILRGEVAGTLGSWSSFRAFVANGYGRPLFRVGSDPTLDPAIPEARSLVVSPEDVSIVDFIEAQAQLGRMTAGPPGIPPARLAALREAYLAALADPALRAEADKLEVPIDPAGGDEVGRKIAAALEQTPRTRALLAAAVPD
jgi:tripartite-type tricarboxylate transporter receptor subunit TctC